MSKINITNIRDHLNELKRQSTVAQTREEILNNEKSKLLGEIEELLTRVRDLNIMEVSDVTPHNLSLVLEKLREHIEKEVEECQLTD